MEKAKEVYGEVLFEILYGEHQGEFHAEDRKVTYSSMKDMIRTESEKIMDFVNDIWSLNDEDLDLDDEIDALLTDIFPVIGTFSYSDQNNIIDVFKDAIIERTSPY